MLETKEKPTVMDMISQVGSEFAQAANPNAKIEAEILISEVIGCNRIELYLSHKRTLKTKDIERLEVLVKKRNSGIPLQYLLGYTYFYGLKFLVEKGVFIPRPETEILVAEVIRLIENSYTKQVNIFELCTGSGNIAVSLTKNIPYCKIISSDIKEQALQLAARNARLHRVAQKITFLQGDLFSALEKDGYSLLKFDMIIANPPYVAARQMDRLPVEVQHEPRAALEAGDDGLKFVRKFFGQGHRFLKKEGYIVFEFGDQHQQQVNEIINRSKYFENPVFFPDLNGIFRFVIARCIHG